MQHVLCVSVGVGVRARACHDGVVSDVILRACVCMCAVYIGVYVPVRFFVCETFVIVSMTTVNLPRAGGGYTITSTLVAHFSAVEEPKAPSTSDRACR
jgi:hypothetical protein